MQKIVTHSGSFHADDVFAVATLQLLLKDGVSVVRTRDEAVVASADWAVDVGGVYDPERQRFDHHQPGAPMRQNGIPYAAFGLVWKHYGAEVCGSTAAADRIEELLVQPVDAGDNGTSLYTLNELGVSPYELYQVVGSYAPPWGSGGSKDDAFAAAVAWAKDLLTRIITQQTAVEAMQQLIEKTYTDARDKAVLVFAVPVSAVALIQYPEVKVVVCPDDPQSNDNWTATTVRKQYDSFEPRVRFPESWAGLRNKELAAVSGIQDAVFCHTARFIFVAGSKESALEAAASTQID